MNSGTSQVMSVLMIAYTNYQTDPRVIRAAEAAVSGGFNVDFIALKRDGEPLKEIIRGVNVIHLDQQRYRGKGMFWYILSYLEFFLRCLFKTSSLYFKKRYKVVHVNNMPDFFVFCALIPKLMGAKVLLDIHDPMPNTFASKFKSGEGGFLYKLLLWQELISAFFADKILTVHDPVKDYVLVKQHGLAPGAIQVIANFADDELFPLRKSSPNNNQLRLVFHGTILERYGLRTAMSAISKMRHKDHITVKIIGEGDFSGQLKKLIKSLNLDKIVLFDNRMYPLHEIPRMLEDCNLGFVPLEISSITEYALPLKLLEYLSLGMPSITVRNTAIGYYFGEDDCFYFDPGDPESLRDILDRLVENPDQLIAYQQRAIVLREKFLWRHEKRKYLDLLRTLTNNSQQKEQPV
jgi:glycosyltransferase involved in cell wall biosynthesis